VLSDGTLAIAITGHGRTSEAELYTSTDGRQFYRRFKIQASVDAAQCAAAKTQCSIATQLFRTTDGGRTWR
jgi:HSP20 family molecular chaperone IbpA